MSEIIYQDKYKVTIPKTVVLSGTSKSASYYVKVQGDIAGYECVYVIPDKSFELYSKNKNAQTATISQEKQSWYVDEFSQKASGLIDAPSITAGHWSGTFYFNISLGNEEVAGDIILPELESWDSFDVNITIPAFKFW